MSKIVKTLLFCVCAFWPAAISGQYVVNKPLVEQRVREAIERQRRDRQRQQQEEVAKQARQEELKEQAREQNEMISERHQNVAQQVIRTATETRDELRRMYHGNMEGSHIVTRQNTATTRQEQTSATTNIRYQAPRPKLSNMLNSIESGIEVTAPGTFLTRAQMDRISQRKIYFPSAIQADHTFGTKIMDKLNELWNADYIDWYEEETPSLRKKAVRATVGKAKKIIETFSVPAGWAIRQIESKQTLLEGTFSLMNDILNDNGAGRKMVESLEKGDFAYTDQKLDRAKGQILDTAEKTVNKATGMKLTRFPANIDEATSKAMAPVERESEDLAIKYVDSKLNADEAKTELKQYIIQSVPDEFVQSWNLLKD